VKHGALCARRRRWLWRAAQLSCCAPSDFAASAGRRSLAVGACRGFRQTPTAKQMARSASRPIKNLIMISHRGWRSRHCILHDPQMCGRFTNRLTWREIVALYRLAVPATPNFDRADCGVILCVKALVPKPRQHLLTKTRASSPQRRSETAK
jgi:hypothetical protein